MKVWNIYIFFNKMEYFLITFLARGVMLCRDKQKKKKRDKKNKMKKIQEDEKQQSDDCREENESRNQL